MANGVSWADCPLLESVPEKMSGAWVFRGTRIPPSAILVNLPHSTIDEIDEDFPSIGRERIVAFLEYLAAQADVAA